VRFVLDNTTLWTGDGRSFAGHVVVRDGLIETVEKGRFQGELPVDDLNGAALSPGLVDIMVNGALGQSMFDGDLGQMAQDYLKLGVTTLQMCSGTREWAFLTKALDNCYRTACSDGADAARVTGVYMEGPFLNPGGMGAHLPEHLKAPTPDNVRYILEHYDHVMHMINVSPGVEHATDAVRAFHDAGKTITMAHSDASAEDVYACLDVGTSQLGHMWDNNDGRQTEPGSPQPTIEHVGLIDPRVRFVHLITDGVHVHPVLVQIVLKCRGLDSICILSDALPCTGIPQTETRYDDGRKLYRSGGAWRMADNGGLIGTALLLPDQFRNFLDMTGAAPHEAIRTVTGNPAAALGMDDQIGLLAPGHCADMVTWDNALQIKRIWRAGRKIDASA